MGFTVNSHRSFGVGSVYKTENPACLLIHLVTLVVHSILALSCHIGLMSYRDVFSRYSSLHIVNVHKCWQRSPPFFLRLVLTLEPSGDVQSPRFGRA